MKQSIGLTALVVRDYDEALGFFIRDPKEESYGTVAVFEDILGNQWDLIQRKHYPLPIHN